MNTWKMTTRNGHHIQDIRVLYFIVDTVFTVIFRITLQCIVSFCIALYYTVMYHIVMYCDVTYCMIVWYCNNLGCVNLLVFSQIHSVGCLKYVKFDEDFKNGLHFKFWASLTGQIFIYSNFIYNIKWKNKILNFGVFYTSRDAE